MKKTLIVLTHPNMTQSRLNLSKKEPVALSSLEYEKSNRLFLKGRK